ncbi:hypothetical protein BamMEX5DRAFT_4975 [Burkholderia ambifaria MEX-5]|uniref:Uncharacterized protein n=1 Tax=Burkholderia ambifaria MEX-5 TaxID=396597 RepID=B1TB09_9BURK|nr:hypothetical protein BamMEX5DRAFT_4975 [Burkholderia ambifaria MEX-5]
MNITRSPGRTLPPRFAVSHALRRTLRTACVAVAAVVSIAPYGDAAAADQLPAYAADLQRTSVSGLSSGGFMAAQFDVAFSSRLIGAGIVAGARSIARA